VRLAAVVPMLSTSAIDETVAFYVAVLDFAGAGRSDDGGWVCLRRDGVEVILARPNAHVPFDRPTFTGSLYFRTDDVEALWARVKAVARVCYPLETFAYGVREFAIYDNNGYLLQFGQPAR
jgi:catechol 2,3-dioxygenase-like lactoylglutathione lyase family enzyme